MCGITGLWGKTDIDDVRGMMARLEHRGPDGSGTYRGERGVLGHRRLAIMDPEMGQQPYEEETLSLAANGEIYNWQSLRKSVGEGHTFKTDADTEVALHLFEEEGERSLGDLDGMFALAFANEEELLLARDPIGIKPLYYSQFEEGGPLRFASEMKALLGDGAPIYELPPGSAYSTKTGVRRFYDLPNPTDMLSDVDDIVAKIRQTLTDATEKRLMSDVPLGAFLSGGLDSSIIVALMMQQRETMHTFSVGLEGSPDLEAARFVSDYLGTQHHEYVFKADEVKKELPNIIYHLESFDQDLVRSVIPTYFTARLAAEHVKVILTGEGADELFAGYTYYRDYEDYGDLHNELRRSVSAMHNVNLQRVDRMTMAHSIEGRVPFLDTALIDLALRIPPELKLLREEGKRPVEKWVLRKAFEDLLPEEIVRRDKAQFDEGSGTTEMLVNFIEEETQGMDVEAFQAEHSKINLRSAEECYYYSIFEEVFENPELMVPNIGRWAS